MKLSNATVASPIDLKILDKHSPQPSLTTTPCVAMIVCHGMGQQVPFHCALFRLRAEEYSSDNQA